MLVLRNDDSLESLTGDARRWLDELPAEGPELPSVV